MRKLSFAVGLAGIVAECVWQYFNNPESGREPLQLLLLVIIPILGCLWVGYYYPLISGILLAGGASLVFVSLLNHSPDLLRQITLILPMILPIFVPGIFFLITWYIERQKKEQ